MRQSDALRERLTLYALDALSDDEKKQMEEFLAQHPDARKTAEEISEMLTRFKKESWQKPSERLLLEARAELRARLQNESSRRSFAKATQLALERLVNQQSHAQSVPIYQLALAAVLIFVLGAVAGYLAFFFSSVVALQPESAQNAMMRDDARIAEVRAIEALSDSVLEVSYDVRLPEKTSGSLSDAAIKTLLARALASDQNPSIRLQAFSILRQTPALLEDPTIKATLTRVAKHDQNAGIRREALNALLQSKPSVDVDLALIHILMRDDNAGLRIAAMNALAGGVGFKPDNALLSELKKRLERDENQYIRARADFLLEELTQPTSTQQ